MATREIADVIGANVRRLRDERGWTQAQLARRVRGQGIRAWSPATVGLVETGGQRADRVLDMIALCRAFRVGMQDLIAPVDGIDTITGSNHRPVELHELQQTLYGVLPDEEGETSTFYPAEEDPYDVARIATTVGCDPETFHLVCYAVFGWDSFVQIRDKRAGVNVKPGTPASLQARRGAAAREMFREIRAALENATEAELIEQGIAREAADAIYVNADEGVS